MQPQKFPSWLSWLSWYKKPEYRDFKEYATNVSSGRRPMSPDGRGGIPGRLRLDRILQNKTCSPMSLYDFYMYLKYIEYSAENLEFYIWFKNYESAYSQGTKELDYASLPTSASQSTSSIAQIKPGDQLAHVEKLDHDDDDDDDDDEEEDNEAAQETLHRISQMISTTALCTSKADCAGARTSFPPAVLTNPRIKAPKLKHDLHTTNGRPLTSELATIISLFLLPNSPKELNIPPQLRAQALADLARTPHPAALQPVADHVYSLLRNCSHRNFVRLGVGNGTFETVCVATVLGWANLLGGFLVVLCRALAPFRGAHSRWEAWAAWPLWWLGMSLVLSGLRGSCFFLLLFSRRQRLPWERFDDEKNGGGEGERGRKGGTGGLSQNMRRTGRFSLFSAIKRLMIFDRRIRVQERYLRRLQRKIVLQSLAGGAVFATLCVGLFIWLPVWRETV